MSSISLSTQSEVKFLFSSLSQQNTLTSDQIEVLNQINTLQYCGFIPSEEALLIKNNLATPREINFSEGILAELILKQIKQGKLAPELKTAIREYGLAKTIFLLYSCHLEQTNYQTKESEAYIIQQRVWKDWKETPEGLLKKVREAEEIESKRYVKRWISSLNVDKEVNDALTPLCSPLTDTEFKEFFLTFLKSLYSHEENTIQKFRLNEMIALLQDEPETRFHLTLSRMIKAFSFYQKHLQGIEKSRSSLHQFSLCIAADAIKNAPYAKALTTSYHKIYGQIKKNWEAKAPLASKSIVLIEGDSLDEKSISKTVEKLFKKIKHRLFTVSSSQDIKSLALSILKKSPDMILGAISPKYQTLLLEVSQALETPLTILSPLTNMTSWEETQMDPRKNLQIAVPTLISSELPESDKVSVVGIPGIFENKRSKKELREKWNLPQESKIILINSPEGDSPWPAHLAKQYKKDMFVIVLTDSKNADFIHMLKTKIAPETQLPLKVYTSASPLEKEELLTLSDLVISKERKEDSSLLFEAWHANTPLLLDNTPSSLFQSFLSFFNFTQEAPETTLHETLLMEENLGIMLRSKENFPLALEELLYEERTFSKAPQLESNILPLVKNLTTSSLRINNKERSDLDLFAKC